MIPIKIITEKQAKILGLTTGFIKDVGAGSINIGISATGKIGNNKAEKIEIINLKTGEKHILFDKGKKNIFKGFKKVVKLK